MPTTKLNLPLIDGSNTADVVRDFNALANAVDNKAGVSDGLATLDATGKVPASQLNVSAPPDASTTTKGVVQLSNSTTSTSETLAATPKAVKTVDDKIGTLSGLNTTAKDNLVNAVNELFTNVSNGKTQIATAITDKGVTASGGDTFPQLATKIGQISTGKKVASGSLSGPNADTFTINTLDFSPSTIILKTTNGSNKFGVYVFSTIHTLLNNLLIWSSSTSGGSGGNADQVATTRSSSGFSVLKGSGYGNWNTDGTIRWIAIE